MCVLTKAFDNVKMSEVSVIAGFLYVHYIRRDTQLQVQWCGPGQKSMSAKRFFFVFLIPQPVIKVTEKGTH